MTRPLAARRLSTALATFRAVALPRVAAAVALAWLCAPSIAQTRKELGRMWTFEAAPLGWFQQAYDWQPDDKWLDHARLASLRLGRKNDAAPGGIQWFCSASFVSPHGLIMTNHHCAREGIAAVQGNDDWLKDGFYAGSYDGEVAIPGLMVAQMVGQRDVTAAVAAKGEGAVLDQAKQQQPDLLHQVIGLYQGGNYQLYSFKTYDDLRLVCAPHGQSAHFGGDPDNFCYPRWGLDFSFVRAWVGGKPADTAANCFEWRTSGANEGEAVFVTGNPGRTGRLKTYAQCEFLRDYYYPPLVERFEKQVAEMHAKAAADPEVEKELRAKILSAENSRKALQGYLDGLRDPRILAIKQRAEAELRDAVAKVPALQEKYGDAWDQIAALQVKKIKALREQQATKEFEDQEKQHEKRIGEACFAVYGTSIPPDATMSLRISDGVVKGYPMNGTVAPYFTTLYGLYARHQEFGGAHPFDLPEAWLKNEKQLDLRTPFNFVATCDIIGGNSGSPMIDTQQRVIGLVFDGNIEMLGNNYVFDDQISRTVAVHPAIIIEALRKIYGAQKLADELERKGAKDQRSGMAAPARGALRGVAPARNEALVVKAQTDVRVVADAVRIFYVKHGALPETLAALTTKDAKGHAVLEQLSNDPWDRPYQLVAGDSPREFVVISVGPDGVEGSADDISSRRGR